MEVLIGFALLLVVFLLLMVIVGGFFFAFDFFLDLPYVTTKKEKIATIIKLANIRQGETIIDLGSGDGRLLIAAAKAGAHAIGYEINPFLILASNIHAKLEGRQNQIEVKKENLWRADLKIADIIFVYGRQKTMQKFEDFVYQNAKKGTRIVVNANPFPSKKPLKSENEIFLHKI